MRAGFYRLTATIGEYYSDCSSIYPINSYEVDGKIGLYDFVNERVQIEPIYSTIERRHKGDYFIVGDGTYKGVIDKTGKMIIPMEYEFILFGSESKFLSIEVRKDGEIGYYDGKGNALAPLGCKEQEKWGYQLISYNGKYGLKNYSKWLLLMDFDLIEFETNSVSVMKDGKHGSVTLRSLEADWPKGKEILGL